MKDKRYQSWGRYPKTDEEAIDLHWRDNPLPMEAIGKKTFLPFGNGRSYGDVCLNHEGVLLNCRGLDRFIRFDPETGIVRCEAGVLLSEILQLTLATGWFLPVTPGTQFVTVGGAIANDVHGKNHHKAGTFGCHVRCFELLRSDGSRLLCLPNKNSELFQATIGGLGLTGVITWAEIQLRCINTQYIDQETIRFKNLAEFFTLARESDHTHEHTVAWVDCLAKEKQLGRGLFIRGNYAGAVSEKPPTQPSKQVNFPLSPPFNLVTGLSVKLFNNLYYRKQRPEHTKRLVHYQTFFYPLDAIYAWNRIYGSKGFFQYQCALPKNQMEDATQEILERISNAGTGSFLAVLKLFGDKSSPGLLSFPLPGATLALDFPNGGKKTLQLLNQLDEVTRSAGGRVNPSKDARMTAEDFKKGYPNWGRMETLKDPQISSSFWRRLATTS